MGLLDDTTKEDLGDDWVGEIDRPYARYLLWASILALGAVVIAVGLQFYANMQPCAWCTLQRLIYLLVAALSLVAWLMADSPAPARLVGAVGLAAAVGGIAAALWQQFVAAGELSCNLTFADKVISSLALDSMMPWLFQARALCDEANLPLFGVPFAIWSAGVFAALVVMLSITTFSRGPLR